MANSLPLFIQDIERFNNTEGTIRIYERGSPGYETLVHHRFENGISEVTPFVLEPGSVSDLRVLMEIFAETKFPFAVKSGGHISIPKIYPPEGYLISMKRFTQIAYDKDKKTLDVGAGLTWREVYDYLATVASDHEVGVVGGDPLVGVSGWLLGGGYSLLTNKYGLGVDNIVGFQVFLPGARTVCNANREENPDLFKALKGGGHNFGIVTQFTLQTHIHAQRRDPVFSFEFPETESSHVKDAMVKFIQNETREVVALAVFRHDVKDNELKSYIGVTCWYYGDLLLDPFSEFRNIATLGGGRDLVQFFFSVVLVPIGPNRCLFPMSTKPSHSDTYRFLWRRYKGLTEIPTLCPSMLHMK